MHDTGEVDDTDYVKRVMKMSEEAQELHGRFNSRHPFRRLDTEDLPHTIESETDFLNSSVKSQSKVLRIVILSVPSIMILTLFACMQPRRHWRGGGNQFSGNANFNDGGNSFSRSVPPSWEPPPKGTVPFREWYHQMICWTAMTDLPLHAQCAAIHMRIHGEAQLIARRQTAQQMLIGGIRNGRRLDAVGFLLDCRRHLGHYLNRTKCQSSTK